MMPKRAFQLFSVFSVLVTFAVGCGAKEFTKETLDPYNTTGTATWNNYHTWKSMWDGESWIVAHAPNAGVSYKTKSALFKNDILKSFSESLGVGEEFLKSHQQFFEHNLSISWLNPNYLPDSTTPQNERLSIAVVSFRQPSQWLQMTKLQIPTTDYNPLFAFQAQRELAKNQWDALSSIAHNQSKFAFVEPDLESKLQETALPAELDNASIGTYFKSIHLDDAYRYVDSLGITQRQVVVAVMDTGVDYGNSDIPMWTNPAPDPVLNDIHGIDASVVDNPDPKSPGAADLGGPSQSCPAPDFGEYPGGCGHGTHVAGLIAARQGGRGYHMGICPSCRILSIRLARRVEVPEGPKWHAHEEDAGIKDSAQLRGFDYILSLTQPGKPNQLQTNVINMSIGKPLKSRAMAFYLREIIRSGIVVVAASGNEGSDTPSYPAAFAPVVSVCAVGTEDNVLSSAKSSFSNFGYWVDVCAPGSRIPSTWPGKVGVAFKSGTSMASPIVAGIAGYLLSVYPSMTNAQVVERIKSTADYTRLYSHKNNTLFEGVYTDGTRFNLLGSGVVDVAAAVKNQTQNDTLAREATGGRVSDGCVVGQIGGRVGFDKSAWELVFSLPFVLLQAFVALKLWKKFFNI